MSDAATTTAPRFTETAACLAKMICQTVKFPRVEDELRAQMTDAEIAFAARLVREANGREWRIDTVAEPYRVARYYSR